jgi:hypothetical protein
VSDKKYLSVEAFFAEGSNNKMVSKCILLDYPARHIVGLKHRFYQPAHLVNTFLVGAAALNQHHFFKERKHIPIVRF